MSMELFAVCKVSILPVNMKLLAACKNINPADEHGTIFFFLLLKLSSVPLTNVQSLASYLQVTAWSDLRCSPTSCLLVLRNNGHIMNAFCDLFANTSVNAN